MGDTSSNAYFSIVMFCFRKGGGGGKLIFHHVSRFKHFTFWKLTETGQNLGPLLKVWLLVRYI